MQNIQTTLPLVLLATLVGLPQQATAQKKKKKGEIVDTIVRIGDKPRRNIEVVEANIDKIVFKRGKKQEEIPTKSVAEIRWNPVPDSFKKAVAAERRGRFEDAGNLFMTAANEAKRKALQLEATFRAGHAYMQGAGENTGKLEAASGAAQKYIDAAGKGFHLPAAQLIVARVKLATGDAAGATALLQQMIDQANSDGWPSRWAAKASFERGRALSAQGKHADARNAYSSVVSQVDSALGEDSRFNQELQSLQTEARVMVGETYIQEKQLSQAQSHFQGLNSASGRGLKAAALAGEGQILFLQAKKDDDSRLLRQAQIKLAQASVVADTTPSTSAKALFYMGKVLKALGDEERDSLSRARSYFQSVSTNYSGTSWADLARKELAGG